jgi:serine/threonine protein kinase
VQVHKQALMMPCALQAGHGGGMGSLTHAAPEQLAVAKATPKADVYAYGVLMFELLTGRQPYHGYSITHNQCLVDLKVKQGVPSCRRGTSSRVLALKTLTPTERCLPLMPPAPRTRRSAHRDPADGSYERQAGCNAAFSAFAGIYRACVSHDIAARPTADALFDAVTAAAAAAAVCGQHHAL